MSGKSSKKLRKIAMGLATTLDQSGTKIEPRCLLARNHTSRLSASSRIEADLGADLGVGPEPAEPVVTAVTAYNRPNSLRGIVQTLKKGIKSGKLSKVPPVSRERLSEL